MSGPSGVASYNFTLTQTGALTTGTGVVRFYPGVACSISNVIVNVGTAPTGASLIVDVNKSGTTIFTTQGNRPTITAGNFYDTSSTPDEAAKTLSNTDYLTVDIDQVGSTIAGSDLVVQIIAA